MQNLLLKTIQCQEGDYQGAQRLALTETDPPATYQKYRDAGRGHALLTPAFPGPALRPLPDQGMAESLDRDRERKARGIWNITVRKWPPRTKSNTSIRRGQPCVEATGH